MKSSATKGRERRESTLRASGDREEENQGWIKPRGLEARAHGSHLSGDPSRHCQSVTVLDPHQDPASVQTQASFPPILSVARGECPWSSLSGLEKVMIVRASWVQWLRESLARGCALIPASDTGKLSAGCAPSSCHSTEQGG